VYILNDHVNLLLLVNNNWAWSYKIDFVLVLFIYCLLMILICTLLRTFLRAVSGINCPFRPISEVDAYCFPTIARVSKVELPNTRPSSRKRTAELRQCSARATVRSGRTIHTMALYGGVIIPFVVIVMTIDFHITYEVLLLTRCF